MSKNNLTNVPPTLESLRAEIDRLDSMMHDALMQRGKIVAQLQAVKKTAISGSAFRPLRELQMMQVFAARHHGDLPLSLVIQLWRNIISTFTYEQANYSVHVVAPDSEAAREHFGFGVPFVLCETKENVIANVKKAKGDLGFICLENCHSTVWKQLGAGNPLIMATYPVLAPPQAVIIAPANTDTQGLETKFVIQNEKLVQVGRDTLIEGDVIGYA